MIGKLLILAISVPFIDLYILVQATEVIGFWNILAIILLTGMVGAEIVRREGMYVLRKTQRSVTAGEISRNVLEIGLLVGGGILLLMPGLITDVAGITIILRPVRERIAAKASNRSSGAVQIEIESFKP